jgi:hypothetical protein
MDVLKRKLHIYFLLSSVSWYFLSISLRLVFRSNDSNYQNTVQIFTVLRVSQERDGNILGIFYSRSIHNCVHLKFCDLETELKLSAKNGFKNELSNYFYLNQVQTINGARVNTLEL